MKRARGPAGRKTAAEASGDAAIDLMAERAQMADAVAADVHVYRVIEIVGSSEKSVEDAINCAVERANQTIRNLRWFEVARTSGHIDNGKVRHYQVTLKVGFTMENAR